MSAILQHEEMTARWERLKLEAKKKAVKVALDRPSSA
jgi:hypothetical protein